MRVRCIFPYEGSNSITLGKIYEAALYKDSYRIIDNYGLPFYYPVKRFEEVDERDENIMKVKYINNLSKFRNKPLNELTEGKIYEVSFRNNDSTFITNDLGVKTYYDNDRFESVEEEEPKMINKVEQVITNSNAVQGNEFGFSVITDSTKPNKVEIWFNSGITSYRCMVKPNFLKFLSNFLNEYLKENK
jgi:hypothetical protein